MTLPFEPRCLSAGHGWLCAGGVDNGQFAIVSIPGSVDGRQDEDEEREAQPVRVPQRSHHAAVDALLPLDLDPEVRRRSHRLRFVSTPDGYGNTSSPARVDAEDREPRIRTYEMGRLIVNSITLHRSPYEHIRRREGVVAVLT